VTGISKHRLKPWKFTNMLGRIMKWEENYFEDRTLMKDADEGVKKESRVVKM
jgi:hypothetical protein